MTTLQRPHAAALSAALRGLQQHERLDVHSYVEADALAAHEVNETRATLAVGKGDLVRVPIGANVHFYGLVKAVLPLRHAVRVEARGDVRVGHTVPLDCVEVLMTREALAAERVCPNAIA